MALSDPASYGFTLVDCCTCGIQIWFSTAFELQRRKDHRLFYCPNGHPQGFFGQTSEQKRIAQLEAQLKAEQAAATRAREAREWAESRAKGANIAAGKAKAAKQRLEQRIARGVCPCCHRTFMQLAAHMKTKHPEYVK